MKTKNKIKKPENLVFKYNYCNGGQNKNTIGFCGACSDNQIHQHMKKRNHNWCHNPNSPCFKYYNNEITREDLDSYDYVCNESLLFKDWTAYAGSSPKTIKSSNLNTLCTFTTRDFNSTEDERFIFAVCIVDELFEGNREEQGKVSCNSKYKIKLSYDEAKKMPLWKYYYCPDKPKTIKWGSSLFRYIDYLQAAYILRDIALIKKDTKDEELANEFYEHFCKINHIDVVGEPNGALTLPDYILK